MKLIFLDLEGVLNSTKFWLKGCPPPSANSPYNMFDPEAISLINKIIEMTDAEIVLTSTLRIYYKKINKFFENIGIKGKLNGILSGKYESERYNRKDEFKAKGKEIAEYIDSLNNPVSSWCIIDDEDIEFLETQKSKLIKTDFINGLTLENVNKIIELLNK